MRKLLITLAILSAVMTARAADPAADRLWDLAGTSYINGEYKTSINYYDSIARMGYSSAKLYYNLGNAYFKDGQTGKSILYYNRAARLRPSDPDIKYNLQIAGTYVKDKIESVPEFFLSAWIVALRKKLSSNAWAGISIALFALALASALLFLLTKRLALRKAGFYTAIVAILLFAQTLAFAVTQRNEIVRSEYAIVMSSSVSVKSSPDEGSKDMFILHEGTKVKVVGTLSGWMEIMIADGNKGWLQGEAIEMI